MKKINVRNMILTALFAALTAVLAQVVVPAGAIPFNLAVFGAFMAGVMLPRKAASVSMCVYLLLGAVGLPVFAGFAGGIGVLLGKTGGYAVGYVAIAFFTALSQEKSYKLPMTALFMSIGLLCCYTLGTIWFMVLTKLSLSQSLVFCVYPFIIPDIIKGAGALFLGKAIRKRLTKQATSRL